VLIGVAAFFLSVWWAMRPQAGAARADRPTVGVIWERFPKFVLGFLAASLVFSFFMDKDLVRETKSTIGSLRTVWFAMGFVSIGLETRFGQLLGMEGGRPFFAFLGGQIFNIFWTLLLAWLVFGGALLS
ncbi:MAG: putative sulfate exporter family transporter, partial [Bryobacterales bacterium]|nr:putative sulfate exporter family transporter [Bryobacterales bacterium]